MKSFRHVASAVFAFALVAGLAQAQDWPSKPIRMIVPYPPGGGTDVVARIVNEKLSPELGQAIVVDNKGGAGDGVMTSQAASAASSRPSATASPSGQRRRAGVAIVSGAATGCECRPGTAPRSRSASARRKASRM